MKSSIGKLTAGIGYGFLFGAAAGLTAGVVLHRLFFWTIIGVVAGVAIGIADSAHHRGEEPEGREEVRPGCRGQG